jgi:hypothetical protein
VATKFCTAAPNICGWSVWLLLAPRILRWLLDFWKIFAPVISGVSIKNFELLYCMAFTARKFGLPRCSLKHDIGLVVTYVPPGLTFTNTTFCPHSVFMCFVCISEQTAIISPNSVNVGQVIPTVLHADYFALLTKEETALQVMIDRLEWK